MRASVLKLIVKGEITGSCHIFKLHYALKYYQIVPLDVHISKTKVIRLGNQPNQFTNIIVIKTELSFPGVNVAFKLYLTW